MWHAIARSVNNRRSLLSHTIDERIDSWGEFPDSPHSIEAMMGIPYIADDHGYAISRPCLRFDNWKIPLRTLALWNLFSKLNRDSRRRINGYHGRDKNRCCEKTNQVSETEKVAESRTIPT
jgi:hypothetical protein